jgi:uncharacterized repeat protein (TIGR03806 family)
MSKIRILLICVAAALLSLAGGLTRSEPLKDKDSAPFGLDHRVAWTTSKIVGAPEPPDPFTTSRQFPELKFDRPTHIEVGPDGKRWFICEQNGKIFSIPTSGNVRTPDLFLDVRQADPRAADKRQIWSMTFHPNFAENGYLYVCYLESKPQPSRNRIVRYTVSPEARKAAVMTADRASEYLILEWLAYEDHFGGCLKFGPDGFLYFSAGDGSGYADGNQSGQDLSDFNASLLRIDVDHADKGKTYAIPKDNPFVDRANTKAEIYAYGLRNVWKFSIDQPTGQIWAADVGQDLWEPLVLVEKGGNYGWSVTEGTHSFRPERKTGPTPILKPVWEHEHSEARSITGGFVYHGTRFPELAGKYVYGDYETGKVWVLNWDAQQKKVTEHRQLVDTPFKLVAFGQDKSGELVLLDYQGTIHRLERNPALMEVQSPDRFPRKLSQTGLFTSTRDLTPAPGVIPYDVNSPLWSDGAAKQRYLAIPGEAKIKYSPDNAWGFPDGSVLVKTFSLEMTKGDPKSLRRLETRILHIEQDHWRGYTYLWNADQTDADLLENPRGEDRVYEIKDAAVPQGTRKQTWHFPSRAECTLCHTMPAGFLLGLNTLQMNRSYDYGDGRKDNQIRALQHARMFDKPIFAAHKIDGDASDPASYEKLPHLPKPADGAVSLNDRARSYLQANCSHCHRKWGGGNALFELTYTLPLDQTKTIDVKPQHGDHGLSDPRLLCPGDSSRSLLLHRMKQTDATRMPRVGSNVVDEFGVKLVGEWIRSLK